jgi:hypothetical protein
MYAYMKVGGRSGTAGQGDAHAAKIAQDLGRDAPRAGGPILRGRPSWDTLGSPVYSPTCPAGHRRYWICPDTIT